MQRGIHVPKILFAAVAMSVLIGIGTWIGVRTLTPTSAVARSTYNPPVMITGAKGLPTSL